MLSIDQLQTFLAVAETGSFTAAAGRLGFTQPAVSQQIRALEEQIGAARLFRRVGQRMHLTQAGETLLGYARDVVALAERAERHLQGLRGSANSRIELACAPSTGERLLPALLAAFRDAHPDVQFSVEVGPAERLLHWLGEGSVQAVVVDEHPRRRTLEALELGSEGVVCIAARGHPVSQLAAPTLADLRATPLILPPRGTALRRNVDEQWRRRNGVPPLVALETDSATVAAHAAADGLGVAFLPYQRVPKNRDLAVVALGEWHVTQPWLLVRARGPETGRAIDDLWAFAASPNGRKLIQRLGLK